MTADKSISLNGDTVSAELNKIRDNFIEGMGRISKFWGFSRLMGQLYGTLYLSGEPMSLDQLTNSLMVSKGSVSTNIRALERWGMVHKVWVKADRKDYYRAETKFMDIMTRILQEREKKEFDNALKTVSECLTEVTSLPTSEETKFLEERLENMQKFFSFIDQSVFSALYLLKSQFDKFF
jgi:DNA-binding transcriptional regulator GbsR (MarR family)